MAFGPLPQVLKNVAQTFFVCYSTYILIFSPYETEHRPMKHIEAPRVIKDADRVHELQKKRRDLIADLRALQAEIEPLREKLLRASAGEDFTFPSSDSFLKVVEIDEGESVEDVEEMKSMLLKLRRKIPTKPRITVVVRYLTDDEIED
jgi:hypothetical protein